MVEEIKLPSDMAAERSVLGAILLDKEAYYHAAEFIQVADFFHAGHRQIFSAMIAMEDAGTAIDLVTLQGELKRLGNLEVAGGIGYISGLVDGVPRISNIDSYAKAVREKAMARHLIDISNYSMREAIEGATSTDILEHAESALMDVRERRESSDSMVPIKQAIKNASPAIQEAIEGGRAFKPANPIGYSDLDGFTGGWQPGEMCCLAARPSEGKTALALEFIRRTSIREGKPTAFFSLEMTEASIVMRLACLEATVSMLKLRTGWLSREERGRLLAALGKVAEAPIWINDSSFVRASDLRWRIRSLAKRHKVKLVVVDYLQLVSAKAENRTQEVSIVSRNLKAAAKEMGKISGGTLLAISQLSRLSHPKAKPSLSDLRESGAIEQDSDLVMFIYTGTKKKAEESQPGFAEPKTKTVLIAKQRNGPSAKVELVFLPEWAGFENLSPLQDDVFDAGPPIEVGPPDHKAAAAGDDK